MIMRLFSLLVQNLMVFRGLPRTCLEFLGVMDGPVRSIDEEPSPCYGALLQAPENGGSWRHRQPEIARAQRSVGRLSPVRVLVVLVLLCSALAGVAALAAASACLRGAAWCRGKNTQHNSHGPVLAARPGGSQKDLFLAHKQRERERQIERERHMSEATAKGTRGNNTRVPPRDAKDTGYQKTQKRIGKQGETKGGGQGSVRAKASKRKTPTSALRAQVRAHVDGTAQLVLRSPGH